MYLFRCLFLTFMVVFYSSTLSAETLIKPLLPSLSPIIQKAMPAIVNIAVKGEIPNHTVAPKGSPQNKPRKFSSLGSGVILDAKKGLILTNAHVVRDAKMITITLNDGRRVKAKTIGSDPSTDIALLKIKADKLQTLTIGDSTKLHVGDFVVAIGNPFGLSTYGSNQTATFGIISALKRSDIKIEGVENFIQTDAAINPGNSGGALINIHGELIGINTAIISPYGGNVGIGLAIPINMAKSVAEQLIKYGSIHRGLMGVYVQHLTPELADAFGLPGTKGALITQVNPGSPAERAGLKAGDVIQKINRETVTDATQVKNIISLLRVGSDVNITLLRNKKLLTLSATVADVKKHQARLLTLNPFLFGLALRNYDEETPMHGRVQGIQITGASESSPAWRAGIRPGDIIIGVNKKSVTKLKSLQHHVSHSKKKLLLHILRGGGSLYFVVK